MELERVISDTIVLIAAMINTVVMEIEMTS